jgi:hypothetical protein
MDNRETDRDLTIRIRIERKNNSITEYVLGYQTAAAGGVLPGR